jgi:tetratricopeptide (TPR) repeat protein
MEYDVVAVCVADDLAEGESCWRLEPAQTLLAELDPPAEPESPTIERRLRYAFSLVDRGAYYSAAAEFRAVLALCALEADERAGSDKHRLSLRDGLVALDEADDFVRHHSDLDVPVNVRSIASAHRTPTVKNFTGTRVSPYEALDSYFTFAEERLVFGSAGKRQASLALYGLGRTHSLFGSNESLADAKAMLLNRAALAVEPDNYLAADNLGALFAKHGHLDEAERVLRYSLQTVPHPEGWKELANVFSRQGNMDEHQLAQEEYRRSLAHSTSRPAPTIAEPTASSTVVADQHSTTQIKPIIGQQGNQPARVSPRSRPRTGPIDTTVQGRADPVDSKRSIGIARLFPLPIKGVWK